LYTKYRQYKFSKFVKVVTRAKAKFSINRWLHLYFSLKLHNIQNEHFTVLKKCKKCFKFNGNVLFCHYGSILDFDKSCNPYRKKNVDKCEHFCKWTGIMVPLGIPVVPILYILTSRTRFRSWSFNRYRKRFGDLDHCFHGH
jgi:hypothetical protein